MEVKDIPRKEVEVQLCGRKTSSPTGSTGMDASRIESGSFWRVGINNEEPWGRDLPIYVIDLLVFLNDVCVCYFDKTPNLKLS